MTCHNVTSGVFLRLIKKLISPAMKYYLPYTFVLLFVLLLTACEKDDPGDINQNENEENTLSVGEQIVEEINMARNALAEGETTWDSYMVEVVEPSLEYIYGGDRYLERIDPITNTNLYLELKNVFENGMMYGGGSGIMASIPQSKFSSIKPLTYSEKLSSGCEKWTNYFINHEVTDYHGDFRGTYDVSEDDEKGSVEVVAPPFRFYDTPRAVVVAWLYDQGNTPRGHRIFLLNADLKVAGGYVDSIQGGATARLSP